jgi:hypothetical protein
LIRRRRLPAPPPISARKLWALVMFGMVVAAIMVIVGVVTGLRGL